VCENRGVHARLLDPASTGRYQQRLTMLGFERHNRPADAPIRHPNACMPSTSTVLKLGAGEAGFPAPLGVLADPPAALWYLGRLPDEPETTPRAVALVGSRAATSAGCAVARGIAAALAGTGRAVISGGALGIDAAAHRGALDGGGATFAVLGCGVDVVYPDRHGPLFADIAARGGGVLSEYPPGTPPRAGHFPVRNRIVAALAGAVVVVDARPASGALITARLGRMLGRRLMAVPGSAGTDALVAGMAAPVTDGRAVLRILAGEPAETLVIPAALAPLVDLLRQGATAPVEVARQLGTTLPEALRQLTEAELSGWVRRLPGGRFEVPRAS
jgi:DNA processing protein